MKKDTDEQVLDEIAKCIGDAALHVLAQGEALTNESVMNAIVAISGDEPEITRDFTLGLLKR